jgi:hypothetical protein
MVFLRIVSPSFVECTMTRFEPHIFHVAVLPYTDSNNIKTKNHQIWMKGRKEIEEIEENKRNKNDTSPLHLIECPSLADVVFRAGTTNVSHPGNAAFRDLLDACQDDYFQAPSVLEKQNIVSTIIQYVEGRQGRFLEWNKCGCWVIMEEEESIRKKIYNSLSHYQKTLKGRKNLQFSNSSTFLFERQDGKKRKRESYRSEGQGCAKVCSFW